MAKRSLLIRQKLAAAAMVDFGRRLLDLFQQPSFIAVTIFGNSLILLSAAIFYWAEFGRNPNLHSFFDAIWWAAATVTTVGFGDVVPLSPVGRMVGLLTMILGSAVFLSYAALFTTAIVSKEITEVESELKNIEKSLLGLTEGNLIRGGEDLEMMIEKLEKTLDRLRAERAKSVSSSSK